ncbi:FAD assembly factor SdhE [Sansalvadorimonas verongulae]|uniref:FAD assembly factor SdhE n=1 Tax=Sansalvadorimonas verongulae TaxID=2172824 RepID=UPI0012BCA9F3|nr:succinate dehydrogenase assembly factor 2 [Sansalvadorimonas verongulae]MTI14107.1 succinate dehydrogenase assembly factor 2 family protein [Sansalvadorimonas verongulae]
MTHSTEHTTQHNRPSQEEMNRLFWHSRRGMLELDVLLVPFSREVYPELSADEKITYNTLLSCEDADLFVWFMEKETPEQPELAAMVSMILERARSLSPVH